MAASDLNSLICLRKRKHLFLVYFLFPRVHWKLHVHFIYIEVEFIASPEMEEKNYSPEEVSEYDDWGFDRDLLENKKKLLYCWLVNLLKNNVPIPASSQLAFTCSKSTMETVEQ